MFPEVLELPRPISKDSQELQHVPECSESRSYPHLAISHIGRIKSVIEDEHNRRSAAILPHGLA